MVAALACQHHTRACEPPHAVLSKDIIESHVAYAHNASAWSSRVRLSNMSSLWHVLGQNTAIMDYFVDAAAYGQGHSAQVEREVTHLRRAILSLQKMARQQLVVCETGFNAGHSAAIWLEPPSTVTLHSFDLAAEPYSQSSQAFVHRLYPSRLTFHPGETTATLPQHASLVEEGKQPPCDLWYIDGGHSGKVPMSDLTHAWRSSRNGTTVIADDCTGRFKDVRKAWHDLEQQGKILAQDANRSRAEFAGGYSGRVQVAAPAPGQPQPINGPKPFRYIVGMKGWCTGVFIKPGRV